MDIISKNITIDPTEWSKEYTFPHQPRAHNTSGLSTYLPKLKPGATLAYKDDAPRLIVRSASMPGCESEIIVLCQREGNMCEREGYFPWSLIKITLANSKFIYSKIGQFFEESEAQSELLQFNKNKHLI